MTPRTTNQFKEIRQEKKEIILSTSLTLFANKGYHSTSISMIANEANISKGLIYNYFKSKEDLLQQLFYDIMHKVVSFINPNHDDEITVEEAEDFFEKFIDVLTANPEEWKLFFQLSIQSDVMEFLINEEFTEEIQKNQKILFDYFMKRNFKDPQTTIILFSSVYKGFAMQYCFAPEMFTEEMVENFKQLMKDMFLRKLDKSKKNIDLDENNAYFLL